MRKTLYSFLVGACLLAPFLLQAQQVQGLAPGSLKMPKHKIAAKLPTATERITASACLMDTVLYPLAKATSLAGLLVNNATSAARVGQYYNAAQPITVHGFQFYAWKTDATGGINATAVCQLFLANPQDSMPMGAALATVNVAVDTNFGGGDLAVLKKIAAFSLPVTVTGPYVVVVGNPTANSIGVVVSDYQAGDGQAEWLAMADLGGNWTPGYGVVLGPFPFDCDVLLQPMVTYNLAADFSHTPSCVGAAGPVTFTNTSSPVFSDRMYNVLAYAGTTGTGVDWDFGDGTVWQQVVEIDTVYNYTVGGNYIATLVDTLVSWTNGFCMADTSIALTGPPLTQFTAAVNGNIVDFTDMTGSLSATYSWDLGDGNTSTLQNVQHTYAALGTYSVCLTVTDVCGTGDNCQNLDIVTVGTMTPPPGGAFTLYPNPNPNAGLAHVALQLPAAQQVQLSIYNHLGQRMQQLELGSVQAGDYDLPLQGLAPGQYLVELRTETLMATQRMQILR